MSKLVGSVYKWSMHRGTEAAPSPQALRERAERERTPDTRDTTGRLLGDPLPGRSALDAKRAAEARRMAGVAEAEIDEGDGDGEREHD